VCAVTAPKLSSFYSIAMWRKLKRYYGAGDLHFITCSCYRRQPWLGTARRGDLFLTVLEQVRRRYPFVVVGYVVMPEHIHLLIGEPQQKTPSTVMQALKLGFARRVIAEAQRLGPSTGPTSRKAREVGHPPVPAQHIWQKRSYDFNVWTEHKRIEKLRYMHRNPVQRGLVASLELWRWSSFRAYSLGETGPVRVNEWEVLKMKIRPPAA
jgi:putative transposase